MKKSILAAALLSITSIASAITETITITIPTDPNPGTITFTGLGLTAGDVSAIDIAFDNGLDFDIGWEITQGSATGLEVTGNSSIRINSFSGFTATPALPPIFTVSDTDTDIVGNAPPPASGTIELLASGSQSYSVNDINAFFAGAKQVDYSALTGASFQSISASSDFEIVFNESGTYTIEAEATYTLIPEPSTGVLFGVGMALLIGRRRR